MRVTFNIFDIPLIRTDKHKHKLTDIVTTNRCHCHIC